MKRQWLIALLFGMGLGIAGLLQAGAPYSRSSWGMFTGPSSSPTFSGVASFADGTSCSAPSISNTGDLDTGFAFDTANQVNVCAGGVSGLVVTAVDTTSPGSFVSTAASTSNLYGDKSQFDDNGIQSGYPATDIAPQPLALMSQSASPLGSTNKTGAPINIGGGWPTMSAVASFSSCNASDSVVVTYLGPDGVAVTKTCTQDAALDDATHFTCGTTNQTLAVKIAACIATATGIGACGGTACTAGTVGFSGTSGSIYVYPAVSGPAALTAKLAVGAGGGANVIGTIVNGTEGKTLVPSVLNFATGASGTIAAATTGISQLAANTIAFGTGAVNSEAGQITAANIIINSAGMLRLWGGTSILAGSSYVNLNSGASNVLRVGAGSGADALGTIQFAAATGTGTIATSGANGFQTTTTGVADNSIAPGTGGVFINSSADLNFWSAANFASGSADANVSRTGSGALAVGTGAAGSTAGTVTLATVTAGTNILGTSTGTLGWSFVSAASATCTATCTNACVIGLVLATGFADCATSITGTCLCAGAN